jgi:hypothetical protein
MRYRLKGDHLTELTHARTYKLKIHEGMEGIVPRAQGTVQTNTPERFVQDDVKNDQNSSSY